MFSNDEEMLGEIIRGLTKCEENITIHSENVLTWPNRIETQRAQTVVISGLYITNNVHTNVQKNVKHTDKRPTTNTFRTRGRCKYCRQEQKLRQCPEYGKRCDECSKLNHFRDICRCVRCNMVNTIEKETVHKQEHGTKMVNMNSVIFNSNHSTIANLKISSNKATIMVPYKVDKAVMGT